MPSLHGAFWLLCVHLHFNANNTTSAIDARMAAITMRLYKYIIKGVKVGK